MTTREALLAWYDASKRDLPWRRTKDPYAIWVSEVMLQQTRVETVIPYYARFLERFPGVHALAEAPLDDVLAMWSGLGYYRRARLLHAGAQHVTENHDGRVPQDPLALRAIPGVGAYTAGAIGSQAFDLPLPVVDGNVARVVSRLHAIDDDMKRSVGLRTAWRIALELVAGERPGDLNNALMELGAVVCVPREPRCPLCPLRDRCAARAQGRERELPIASEKPKQPRVVEAAALLHVRGRKSTELVFVRCTPKGLFAGLWEPPRIPARNRHAARASLEAMLGADVSLEEHPVRRVEHVLSHRKLDVTVWRGTIARRPRAIGPLHRDRYDQVEVITRRKLDGRGVSTLARRVLGDESTTGAERRSSTKDRDCAEVAQQSSAKRE